MEILNQGPQHSERQIGIFQAKVGNALKMFTKIQNIKITSRKAHWKFVQNFSVAAKFRNFPLKQEVLGRLLDNNSF
jgi:hypothetical protein